ncbi:MAG: hypothetical protein QOJ27_2529 [Sphingomonadales bacterium]|nr:hypothetical protein [Sphingomonadales bacterium]
MKSAVLQGAARGALANAATQGVSVATGLQKKFDWTGVAVAGVVSGVTAAISGALPGHAVNGRAPSPGSPGVDPTPPSQVNQFASSLGGAIAGAGVRSILTGTSFGDNILAVLPDVIGSTIGNLIGRALTDQSRRRAEEAAHEDNQHTSPPSGEASFDLRDPIVFPDLAPLNLDGLDPYWGFGAMRSRLEPPNFAAAVPAANAAPVSGSDLFFNFAHNYSITDNGTLPWYQFALTYGGPTDYLQANENYLGTRGTAATATRILSSVDELIAKAGLSGYEAARSSAAYMGMTALVWHNIGQQGYPLHDQVARYIGGVALERYQLAQTLAPPPPTVAAAAPATDGRNLWNRGWSALADGGDWLINGGLGLYNRARDGEERVTGTDPYGLGVDVAVGFVSTILRAGTGLLRTVGDPQAALFGVARGIDSIFLDSRPASQVVRENWARLSSSSAREIAMGTGNVAGQIFLIVGPAKAAAGRLSFASEPSAFAQLEPLATVNPRRAGVLAEGQILDAIGSIGKVTFTPTAAQIESAAFRTIVGEPKYTAGGAPVSTIYDGSSLEGLLEIKTGRSALNSSYQLRLQTYGALVNNQRLTILTSRPVGPQFHQWLGRWGVEVQPLPPRGH